MEGVVILDSGVLLASVFPDELYSLQAVTLLDSLLEDGFALHAPMLLRYEIVASLRKAVYRTRISQADAVVRRDLLLVRKIQFYVDDTLLKRAFDIATELNQPTAYDAQYLALAEQLGCELWTADERLFNAAQSRFGFVRWLGQFKVN